MAGILGGLGLITIIAAGVVVGKSTTAAAAGTAVVVHAANAENIMK